MYRILKIILGVLGSLLLVIGFVVVVFLLEMKPDKEEEEKIKLQAEQYLEDRFDDNFEIYDAFYDNMGNFNFEYAAMARDKGSSTQFFIYYDEGTNQLVDTYIADKWEDDLEDEIRPFVKEYFGETTNMLVFIGDKNIGQELDINPLEPRSYKEFNVTPTIRITVPRKRNDRDEKMLDEFISFLKSDSKLQHGSVIMGYVAENGAILNDEWSKKF
ncbi:hypothetical protein [Psychrobacillus sp. NPDC093180]|uniref:hypothetical protein n=1 Tax=Psychrobacillus sp. NPDC093180 TaxID=3364489 RepID=UPI003825B0A4